MVLSSTTDSFVVVCKDRYCYLVRFGSLCKFRNVLLTESRLAPVLRRHLCSPSGDAKFEGGVIRRFEMQCYSSRLHLKITLFHVHHW